MMKPRLLPVSVLALMLGLFVAACGSDDETRPLPTSGTIDMNEGSPTPTATESPVPEGMDPEDVPIERATQQRLERIALKEVGGGRVEEIERSDDVTHAYEVEVEQADDDYTVLISEDLEVVGVEE